METEGDPNRYEVRNSKKNQNYSCLIYNFLQKPTHQIFYNRILDKQEQELLGLHWTVLQSKMRNLKTLYLKAVEWKKNTGAGLQQDGKERTIAGNL